MAGIVARFSFRHAEPRVLPDGLKRTFGEMMPAEKHAMPGEGSQALSHRARAFQALAKAYVG
jgi:XTP/dITP diphosphohydrolase